jgi:hypothetical protein
MGERSVTGARLTRRRAITYGVGAAAAVVVPGLRVAGWPRGLALRRQVSLTGAFPDASLGPGHRRVDMPVVAAGSAPGRPVGFPPLL